MVPFIDASDGTYSDVFRFFATYAPRKPRENSVLETLDSYPGNHAGH